MDFNLEVIFQNMPEMKSIRRSLENEVEKLSQKFEGIENCKISVDLPYHHRYPGNIYQFEIELIVPGHKVKVERSPSAEGASSDIFSLIREAFDEASRKLDACACARDIMKEKNQARHSKLMRRPETGAHF